MWPQIGVDTLRIAPEYNLAKRQRGEGICYRSAKYTLQTGTPGKNRHRNAHNHTHQQITKGIRTSMGLGLGSGSGSGLGLALGSRAEPKNLEFLFSKQGRALIRTRVRAALELGLGPGIGLGLGLGLGLRFGLQKNNRLWMRHLAPFSRLHLILLTPPPCGASLQPPCLLPSLWLKCPPGLHFRGQTSPANGGCAIEAG